MNIFIRTKSVKNNKTQDFDKYNLNIVDKWEDANIIWVNKLKIPLQYLLNKKLSLYLYDVNITVKYNLSNTISILFGKNAQIAPETFVVTEKDLHNQIANIKRIKHNKNKIFIVKPGNSFASKCTEIMYIDDIYNFIVNAKNKDCNNIGDLWIVQEYIANPLLIKSPSGNFLNKFDLRVVFIMFTNHSTSKINIYQYKKIIVKNTNHEFVLDNFDSNIHITNRPLDDKKLDKTRNTFLDDTESLQKYVKNINNFILNYIVPLLRFVYIPDTNVYSIGMSQRFGIDIMIDSNHNIKLLEINENPDAYNLLFKDTQLRHMLKLDNTENLKHFTLLKKYPTFVNIDVDSFTNKYNANNTFFINDKNVYVDLYYGEQENNFAKYRNDGNLYYNNGNNDNYYKLFLYYHSGCKKFKSLQLFKLFKFGEHSTNGFIEKIKEKVNFNIIRQQLRTHPSIINFISSLKLCEYQILYNVFEIYVDVKNFKIYKIKNFNVSKNSEKIVYYTFAKIINIINQF